MSNQVGTKPFGRVGSSKSFHPATPEHRFERPRHRIERYHHGRVTEGGFHDLREYVETEDNVGDDPGKKRRPVCRRVVNAERDEKTEHVGDATQRQRVREGYRRGLCALEHTAGRGEGRNSHLFQAVVECGRGSSGMRGPASITRDE